MHDSPRSDHTESETLKRIMIGLSSIGWFSPDGSLDTTLNRFDYTEVYEIMAKYADPEILAEHYEYFPK